MSHLPIVPIVACVPIVATVWLVGTARQLSCKRNELSLADKQLAIYSQRCTREQDDPAVQIATEQVELSFKIYQNVAREYNRCIAKVRNRPVAWLLGYRMVSTVKKE